MCLMVNNVTDDGEGVCASTVNNVKRSLRAQGGMSVPRCEENKGREAHSAQRCYFSSEVKSGHTP